MRWRRTGDPDVVRRRVGLSAEERFWQYVDKTAGGCWRWTGGASHGYGTFMVGRADGSYAQVGAHRFAYQLASGPVPDGLVLDHLCRNKWCVRPTHLEPVTQQTNVLRGDATFKAATCRRGHQYDGENTYITPTGNRQCKTCRRVTMARHRATRRLR